MAVLIWVGKAFISCKQTMSAASEANHFSKPWRLQDLKPFTFQLTTRILAMRSFSRTKPTCIIEFEPGVLWPVVLDHSLRMTDTNPKPKFFNLTLPELTEAIKAHGHPGFRAQQLYRWVHALGLTDFEQMT